MKNQEMTPKRIAMRILHYTTKVMAANEVGSAKFELASRIFRRHYGTAMFTPKKVKPLLITICLFLCIGLKAQVKDTIKLKCDTCGIYVPDYIDSPNRINARSKFWTDMQSSAQSKDIDTIEMAKHNTFNYSAFDTASEIFSFRMTGDTNKLKPIDTIYYTMGNKINREIKYRYFIGKEPYYLITRSEYSNQTWLLFSIQFSLYKKD